MIAWWWIVVAITVTSFSTLMVMSWMIAGDETNYDDGYRDGWVAASRRWEEQ